MEGKIPISLLIFFIGCFTLASAFEEQRGRFEAEPDVDLDKRPFDFLKKPYHYMSEYKRLPLYNFGLGKRSPRYNFGLGKRYPDEEEGGVDYEEYPFAEEFAEPELYAEEEDFQLPDKRQRPYSFGLGKRLPKYDFGLGKRTGPYDFGLGKRTQRFNFGLGKRNGLYSFGLGKKASESGSLANRFSFGLGKRSEDSDSDGSRSKREAKELTTSGNKNDSRGADEILAHDLEKRSKNSVFNSNNFSRRFRKPFSYNFGLGKRIPLYDFGLGKRNYQNYDNVF